MDNGRFGSIAANEIARKAERKLRKGHGLNKGAKTLGIGVGTLIRIKQEMSA
jgi:hypothetical protein